jgi:4-hydroxybenzoate polyprenyltransferase
MQWAALLRAMRPHQWVKNLFVFAPLIFAKQLGNSDLLLRSILATSLFCLLSGAVYLINDILDVESDRNHPVKCNRPIASGALSVVAARSSAILLVALSLGLGWWGLNQDFALIALGYFTLNLVYSMWLKHVAYLDVGLISGGFVLRVLAGAYAITVDTSRWLVVCTMLLALFLGFGKRLHELKLVGSGAHSRKSLAGYNEPSLRRSMLVLGLMTAGAYVAYALDPVTVAKFDTKLLVLTAPCILFGLFRFQSIVSDQEAQKSPTERMIHDVPFVSNLFVWGAAVLIILNIL